MANTCWQRLTLWHVVSNVINLYFQVVGRVSKKKLPITFELHIHLLFS